MMSCEEFTASVTDFLDGRVPFGKQMGMWMHRLMCVRCRNYLRQMQEVLDFIATHDEAPQEGIDEDTRRDLVDKFRHKHGPDCDH